MVKELVEVLPMLVQGNIHRLSGVTRILLGTLCYRK